METLNLSPMIESLEIQKKVKELGEQITKEFNNEDTVAICVLKGSFVFFSDLVRAIDLDLQCEFMGVSSYYGGTKSSGEVKLTLDLMGSIEGKNVLLVEDIVDTGLTMNYLKNNLLARMPKKLVTVTLLHKPKAMKVECQLDYVGFEIENRFVVGYGLDYQGLYRNLPHIAQADNLN